MVEHLVVYGVVDDEPEAAAIPPPWEVRLVAPLGTDRSRFLALLREMTGRDAAVIRGQLLAMASRPGRDRDEATVGNLTGALHRLGYGAAEDLEKSRFERIWQARLLLKLAEVVKVAEAEIGLSLAGMARQQAAMLKALQGGADAEGEDELPLVVSMDEPVLRQSFRTREQLSAWSVFYCLDSRPEALMLTDDPEAAALLADEVEKLAPGQVISLPALEFGMAENDRAIVVEALQDILAGQVEAGRAALSSLAETGHNSKPPGGVSPTVLRLQVIPGAKFRQVMAELSGLPGEDGATALPSPVVLVGAITPGEAA